MIVSATDRFQSTCFVTFAVVLAIGLATQYSASNESVRLVTTQGVYFRAEHSLLFLSYDRTRTKRWPRWSRGAGSWSRC